MTPGRPAKAIVGVAATVGWMASITSLHGGRVFLQLGLYSLAVIVAVLVTDGAATRASLRPTRRLLALGLGAGLAFAGLTHAGYAAVSALLPAFRPLVSELYALFWQPPGPALHFHWLLVIVVAEELLWRGLWVEQLVGERPWLGAGLAVLLYALGQAGSGSLVVVGLAIGCGVVWTALRVWSRSLWPPLVTHAIWNLLVLVIFPLESP